MKLGQKKNVTKFVAPIDTHWFETDKVKIKEIDKVIDDPTIEYIVNDWAKLNR